MKNNLKKRIYKIIDDLAGNIIAFGEKIKDIPETGFCEYKTSKEIRDLFRYYQIPYYHGKAITAIKGRILCKAPEPRIGIIGEMDALPTPQGCKHSCGHYVEIAILLGTAIAFKTSGIYKQLCGTMDFFAVPAEEFVNIEERMKLRDANKIKFISGKAELIRLGEFDNIDMAILVHPGDGELGNRILLGGRTLGFILKKVKFFIKCDREPLSLKENPLNIALSLVGDINSRMRNQKDKDGVWVVPSIKEIHSFRTAFPQESEVEILIKGEDIPALLRLSKKLDSIIKEKKLKSGMGVIIQDYPGHFPLYQDRILTRLFYENAADLIGKSNVIMKEILPDTTDLGDLSSFMPVIHPLTGGMEGIRHNEDYQVKDPYFAYIIPIKILAGTLIDLLTEKSIFARVIKNKYKPVFSKEKYIELQNSIFKRQIYL